MRNIITVNSSGGQTLSTTNDGSNILTVNGTSYDTQWLNSSSYTVTISDSYHVYIDNNFVGESGNYYLVLDHIDTSAQYHVDYYYNVAKYGTKYVYGEKNEKFNLENAISKSQAINTLKTNFQAGVDTIYNALVARGVRPASSTPQAIAAAIATMYSQAAYDANYTAGRNQGRADKSSGTLDMIVTLGRTSSGDLALGVTLEKDFGTSGEAEINSKTWRITNQGVGILVEEAVQKSVKFSYNGKVTLS